MTIEDVTEEAPDVKTFHLVFKDEKMRENFEFETGQFGEYSAFGHGECTFCIASASSRKGFIQCTFRKSGKVTDALYNLEIGDTIGSNGLSKMTQQIVNACINYTQEPIEIVFPLVLGPLSSNISAFRFRYVRKQ